MLYYWLQAALTQVMEAAANPHHKAQTTGNNATVHYKTSGVAADGLSQRHDAPVLKLTAVVVLVLVVPAALLAAVA